MTLAPSAQRFPELFPFHLVVDSQLVICQLGPALARLLGPGICGSPLLEQVRWHRPQPPALSLAGLARLSHKLIVLEMLRLPLQLKGQLLVEERHAFFLSTPVVHNLEQIKSLGIRLSDIARHDALADALVMLQTKDMTIAERVQRRTLDLERLATRDALTGVGNRLLFNRELSSELAEQRRRGAPLVLLLVDVDHFKQYNDRHGHPAGDACLRGVAQRLVELVGRGSDRVYRYGGEEFAVMLPATDLEGGQRVAERIVQGFARVPLLLESGPGEAPRRHRITVSAGLACADPRHQGALPLGATGTMDATLLIARADKALYQAKNGGRSRFVSESGAC